MIIRCKTIKQFRITLSFLKEKGYRWYNGEDLENEKLILDYWYINKTKTYLVTYDLDIRGNDLGRGKVCYGGLSDLDEDDDEDKKSLIELKANENIPITEENLNKIYLISQLKK